MKGNEPKCRYAFFLSKEEFQENKFEECLIVPGQYMLPSDGMGKY
jgi:hypothetical protein